MPLSGLAEVVAAVVGEADEAVLTALAEAADGLDATDEAALLAALSGPMQEQLGCSEEAARAMCAGLVASAAAGSPVKKKKLSGKERRRARRARLAAERKATAAATAEEKVEEAAASPAKKAVAAAAAEESASPMEVVLPADAVPGEEKEEESKEADGEVEADEADEAMAGLADDVAAIDLEGDEDDDAEDADAAAEDDREGRYSSFLIGDYGPPKLTRASSDASVGDEDADTEFSESSIFFKGKFAGRDAGISKDIRLVDMDIAIKGKELLRGAKLMLKWGHRYGLVGRNGIGKSCLLRRIASHRILGFPSYIRCLHVTQEADGSPLNALETVIQSDAQRTALLEREEELYAALADGSMDADSVSEELREVGDEMDAIGAASAEGRATSILRGLGFSEERMARPTEALSGGWRMRVSLACALFLAPDLLMLDEPSNALDLEAVLWLQDYVVNQFEGTLVVVSHDKALLDAVATDIIVMGGLQLTYYEGCNMSEFERVAAEKAAGMKRLATSLDSHRAHVEASMKRMEAAARRVKKGERASKKLSLIASRKKKMERMGLEKRPDGKKHNCQKHGWRIGSMNSQALHSRSGRAAPSLIARPEKEVVFSLTAGSGIGDSSLLQVRRAMFNYASMPPERPLLDAVQMDIAPRARIALLGRNGAGKSTLLQLLAGVLKPLSGEVLLRRGVRAAYYAQHHADALDLSLSPVQHLQASYPDADITPLEARKFLGGYGLTGRLALQRTRTLSGGQQSRLVLATLAYAQPHLLLLDEPTTHFDYQSIQALIKSVKAFKGAVVFVTHNQQFASEVADECWLVTRGTVSIIEGGWDAYAAAAAERRARRRGRM